MRRYRTKVVEVQAIQWDGSPASTEEIARFAGVATQVIEYDLGSTLEVNLPDEAAGSMAEGDWIVKHRDGGLQVFNKEDNFLGKHEEIF